MAVAARGVILTAASAIGPLLLLLLPQVRVTVPRLHVSRVLDGHMATALPGVTHVPASRPYCH